MTRKTSDGSILDDSGRILYFSLDRFVADICEGDCCFVCGRTRESTVFNDEHVLPRWILKQYSLFDRNITLPNLTGFRYGQYKVPCCAECNSLMGEMIEKPVREIVTRGVEAVAEHIESRGAQLFFVWLSIIFFKTHFRDRYFRAQRHINGSGEVIADLYDWSELHHAHCVARSFYTGAVLTREAFGSFYCLAAKTQSYYEHFDYMDLWDAKSVLMRLGDVCLISVLNDSTAALSKFMPLFERITGALSPLQLREVLAHLAYINSTLKERPLFATEVKPDGESRIVAFLPPAVELEPLQADFGEIFYAATFNIVEKLSQPNAPAMLEAIRKGQWRFLFDDEGNFIEESVIPNPV
jgi:hypothetical protein